MICCWVMLDGDGRVKGCEDEVIDCVGGSGL
mgnify:CR=1 FL=1